MKSKTSRNNKQALASAPLPGLIAAFAIPSIISLLVNAAYNITDQIFIGHMVGMLGNAATNVAFPTVSIMTALAQMIGVGTSANFNIQLGAKEEENAKQYVGTGLTMMACTGLLLFLVVFLFKNPILTLCGATEKVFPYASTYLGITMFGLPFALFVSSSSMLIRADGSPSYSMFCTISGAILNVFLDWLFMFVFHWGIQGSAAATVTGQFVSFLLCLRYFSRFKTFQIDRSKLRLKADYMVSIAKLGTANFINHLVMTIINIVMNNTLKYYGSLSVYGSDIPLAVSGVVAKLNTILTAFTVGLAQGCQPIWSYNMGAKNYSRIKGAYKRAVSVALLFSMMIFAMFQLFPRQITSIFGSGNELYYQFAERYLRIFMMMVGLFGIQPLSVNYFTSIGNVRQGIILSTSRQGFLLLPLLLILPHFLGLNGVLYAGPIADGLAVILSLLFMRNSFRHLADN